MRVLLIEDNDNDMTLARRELESAGHTVIEARRAERGIELAHEYAPQAILCDLGLPGDMDGYDFAERCKNDPALKHIPLIALTGGRGHVVQARAARVFDSVLEKPLDVRDLQQRVSDHRPNGNGAGVREIRQAAAQQRFDPAQTQEVEVTTPAGKFRARGYDAINMLLIVGVAVMCALFYRHVEESTSAAERIVKVIEQQASSNMSHARALERLTCIIALDQNKRESAYDNPYSRCNRPLSP